jgi:hypothetical protein
MTVSQQLSVTVLYDFEARDETDLSVKEGDILQFVEFGSIPSHEGWTICIDPTTCTQGFIPTAYHSTPFVRTSRFVESQLVSQVTKMFMKRRALIKETIQTEETYCTNLRIFCDVYAQEAKDLVNINSSFTESDYNTLFKNVRQILGASIYLLDSLKKQVELVGDGNEELCCIGKVFSDMAPFFKMYKDFINNYEKAYDTYRRLLKHKFFKNYLQVCAMHESIVSRGSISCDLSTLLINPIQRIPRYKLLLEGIREATDSAHEDFEPVQVALDNIAEIARYCDESKTIRGSLGTYSRIANILASDRIYSNFMQSHRRFIAELRVNVCVVARKIESSFIKDIATTKECIIYLFSDCIVLETLLSKQISSPRLKLSPRFTMRQSNTSESTEPVDDFLLVFLSFCNVISKPMSTTFTINSVIHGSHSTIFLKACDHDNEEYQEQYLEFIELLQDCTRNIQNNSRTRFDILDQTDLMKLAQDRIVTNSRKQVEESEYQSLQAHVLDMKKKIHITSEEIENKQAEIMKLTAQIQTLSQSLNEYTVNSQDLAQKLEDQESTVNNIRTELTDMDNLLFKVLNSETDAFQRVFLSDRVTPNNVPGDAKDIYHGKKLRRRASLNTVRSSSHHLYESDYTGFTECPLMEQFEKQYGDIVIVFSSLVYLTLQGTRKLFRLVITNDAFYLLEGMGSIVKYHVQTNSIVGISVSTLDDHFFVIHCAHPHDFIVYSVKKTEIIEILQFIGQCKHRPQHKLQVNVVTSIACNIAPTIMKTLAFEPRDNLDNEYFIAKEGSHSNEIWKILYNPDAIDTAFLSNKTLLLSQVSCDRRPSMCLADSTEALHNDVYNGKKLRRRVSIDRQYCGDYMSHFYQKKLRVLPIDSDKIKFCDQVMRMNYKLKSRSRPIIITDSELIIADPGFKAIKRSIQISEVEFVSVSSLSDNYLVLHMESGDDEVMYSERKSEIVQILQQTSNTAEGFVVISNSPTFRKKNREYNASFEYGSENTFHVTSDVSFNVSVCRQLKSPLVVESMEIQFEGSKYPLILCPDSTIIPRIRIKNNRVQSFSAIIHYFVLDAITGYHIEQKLSASSHVLTEIEACDKTDDKCSIALKRQTLSPPRFGKKTRKMRTRVLDHLGNQVGLFQMDIVF